MASIKHFFSIILSILTFFTTFYSMFKFMYFLSKPMHIGYEQTLINNLLDNKTILKGVLFAISIDLSLIVLFILQHSLMRTNFIKSIWEKIGLNIMERCVYNILTSLTLLFLLNNWYRVPTNTLWYIDVSQNSTLWWTFVLIHIVAWSVIYGGSLIMDLGEILGMKQVYYDVNNLQSPMAYKTTELRRLYSHMRHPSFTGLSCVFWLTNCMTLDRLVLAVMLTLYMFFAWNTEQKDFTYQKNQLIKKKYELSHKIR